MPHASALRDFAGAEPAQTRARTRIVVVGASGSSEEDPMADKSPKKSSEKTAASKSLKEMRADKKDKAASKRKD
jgi:hypothetical protein